jgi:hypothetical protein
MRLSWQKKCFDAEFDRCANQHLIAGMLPALLSFERQGQVLGLLGTDDPAASNIDWVEAKDYGTALMRKCFHWDLEFSSAGKFVDGADGYDSSVRAKIPIQVEGSGNAYDVTLTGKSALINESYTFKVQMDDCNVISNRGDGEFQVMALTWENEIKEDPDGTPRFYVKDFKLSYFPGRTSETSTFKCWDPGPPRVDYPDVNIPPAGIWTATYVIHHYKEMNSGNGDGQPPNRSVWMT